MIKRIILNDFLSYEKVTIDLEPGVNSITGKSGAGKTNIVTAIGWAMFGYNSFNNTNELVRIGANVGTVEIVLESGDVTATINKSTGGTWTFNNGDGIFRGATDVMPRIAEFLDLKPETSLTTLWQHFVSLQQLKMLRGFDDTTSDRKRIFQQILGVHEYDKAWKQLSDTIRLIQSGLGSLDIEYNVQLARAEGVEDLKKRISDIEAHIGSIGLLEEPDKSLYNQAKLDRDKWQRNLIELEKLKANHASLGEKILSIKESIATTPQPRYDFLESLGAEVDELTSTMSSVNPAIKTKLEMEHKWLAELEREKPPSNVVETHQRLHDEWEALDSESSKLDSAHAKIVGGLRAIVESIASRVIALNSGDGECPTCGEEMCEARRVSLVSESKRLLVSANEKLSHFTNGNDEGSKRNKELSIKLNAASEKCKSSDLDVMRLKKWEDKSGDELIGERKLAILELEGFLATQERIDIDSINGRLSEARGKIAHIEHENKLSENLPKLESDLKLAERERESAFGIMTGIDTSFDKDRFDRIESEWIRKDGEFKVGKASLDNAMNRLAEYTSGFDAKQAAHDSAKKLSDRISNGNAKLERLDKIRAAIKGAAPFVSAAMVAEISSVANRMFSGALDGHCDASLTWNPDYSLSVVKDGNEMGWRVSGGERTFAALTVRLAMLNVVGGLGLLVADEVTMGTMDKELQEAVPWLILDTSDLCQVIVIDHGGLFNDIAATEINVVYENGRSIV